MIFNKKGLFGGGLCLVNTAVIAISTSSVVVAQNDIRQARNALNQICWRIFANNVLKSPVDNKFSWIKNGYYWNSIVKVIGKAIGDCVTKENEFKSKKSGDIITFANTKPEIYYRENWNAVILYDFVHKKMSSTNVKSVTIDSCFDRIKQYYSNKQLNINLNFLDQARNDMKQYDKALGLSEFLDKCRKQAETFKTSKSLDNIATLPVCHIRAEESSGGPVFEFYRFYAYEVVSQVVNNKAIFLAPRFGYKNGKLFILQVELYAGVTRNGKDYDDDPAPTKDYEPGLYSRDQYLFKLFEGLIDPGMSTLKIAYS